jgi:hypothetical protein
MRAALCNDDAFDEITATRAGFSILLIDVYVVVVVASFPPKITIIV